LQFSKETKNGRWRAYSKGCIDLCERYSAFCIKERALLGEAPKDIKRLEVLKPTGEPDMGTRHEAAIAKEKRLEQVTRPATKRERQEEPEKQEEKKTTSMKNAKKQKIEVNKADLSNTAALKEDDKVAEGFNWSDDEDSSSDEDSD
jgi:hypothetical protein